MNLGWIALAFVIFGGWNPWRVALACFVYRGLLFVAGEFQVEFPEFVQVLYPAAVSPDDPRSHRAQYGAVPRRRGSVPAAASVPCRRGSHGTRNEFSSRVSASSGKSQGFDAIEPDNQKEPMHAIEEQATDPKSPWAIKHIEQYLASDGEAVDHPSADRLILLYTTGQKSGRIRRTPVVHFPDGDAMLIVASKGSSPNTRCGMTTSSATRPSGFASRKTSLRPLRRCSVPMRDRQRGT